MRHNSELPQPKFTKSDRSVNVYLLLQSFTRSLSHTLQHISIDSTVNLELEKSEKGKKEKINQMLFALQLFPMFVLSTGLPH